MDALELMSEGQQHWGRVREEERKEKTEGREREREEHQGRSRILGKADETEVQSWQEKERARDEVELEWTRGAEYWYQRTQWESTKFDPVVLYTQAQIRNACRLEDQLGEGSLWVSAPLSIIGFLALLLQGALETQTPGKQK